MLFLFLYCPETAFLFLNVFLLIFHLMHTSIITKNCYIDHRCPACGAWPTTGLWAIGHWAVWMVGLCTCVRAGTRKAPLTRMTPRALRAFTAPLMRALLWESRVFTVQLVWASSHHGPIHASITGIHGPTCARIIEGSHSPTRTIDVHAHAHAFTCTHKTIPSFPHSLTAPGHLKDWGTLI